ncbi:Proline permease [Dermatophilus congolensis]|uniref:Sodium/proline symporter n=1 Tax=Dermatophilus congolensis TaxID=1863 RepID=A0A239V701_9MICO|nr:sodium/proline symporter PutP [Dermatophilus congolensis]SNV17980.1 Proline permease [Dermatophilus congolensis]
MTDTAFQIVAMVIYLAAMLGIGWYSYHRTNDLGDYMLGGRDLHPAVAALSAGAADMSGWLLMGLPGAIYLKGLVEAWIAVGLTLGAWINWKLIAPRLRAYTEVSGDSITVPSFLENRLRDHSHALRIASGLIILIFFTFYVSSGMVAGGTFMESSFGTDYLTGMLIIAAVTVTYSLFGGFLAVSYTDFVQGLMMVLALIAVPVAALIAIGTGNFTTEINAANPTALSFTHGATTIGVISSLAWGLGYFGQPHIVTRFMALRSPAEAIAGRRIGIGWMLFSVGGAIITGLVGIAYFSRNPDLAITNPETVFIRLGQLLFHPLIAGFMLAAVLAAIMSTIASQLIVTSSALIEDIYKALGKTPHHDTHYVRLGRLAVLAVSIIAALLALDPKSTILELVAFAWAGFGAAFGPTILLSLYWRKLTTAGALAGMITGATLVAIWRPLSGGIFDIYEIIPGFLGHLLIAYAVSLATHKPNPTIDTEFDEHKRRANNFTQPAQPTT